MTRLTVEFDWQRIGLVTSDTGADGALRLRFPDELSSDPGVYRLLFVAHGPAEVYIGESDNVRRRGRQYRRGDGSQKTSRWVHEHLRSRLSGGATVTIDLMIARDMQSTMGRGETPTWLGRSVGSSWRTPRLPSQLLPVQIRQASPRP